VRGAVDTRDPEKHNRGASECQRFQQALHERNPAPFQLRTSAAEA
jgi:hypothetical protein